MEKSKSASRTSNCTCITSSLSELNLGEPNCFELFPNTAEWKALSMKLKNPNGIVGEFCVSVNKVNFDVEYSVRNVNIAK